MVVSRRFASCAVLVWVSVHGLACGSGDDDGARGSQSDASAMAPLDATPDAEAPDAAAPDGSAPDSGIVPGDHAERCLSLYSGMCRVIEGDDTFICQDRHHAGCHDRCLGMLDGFSDECGECIGRSSAGETHLLGIVSVPTFGERCMAAQASNFPFECVEECAGNAEPISAVERVARCDGLCAPMGSDNECASEVEAECWSECRDRLEGLPARCASCLVGLSLPPAGLSDPTAAPVCTRETWATIQDCAAFCR